MNTVTRLIPVEPKPKPEHGTIAAGAGQIYLYEDTDVYYGLSQIDVGLVCLISIGTFNRYNRPIRVGDASDITVEEFTQICGGSTFTRVHYPIVLTPEPK